MVHVHFPIDAQSTTVRSCRPAAVQPPSISLQLYARVAPVEVADCFDRNLRCYTPLPLAAGGMGTIRPLGSRCRRFGREPCSVSRVASLCKLGMEKATPRVSATSPGMVLPHPLSPCTHVRFGCKTGFSCS